MRKNQFKPSDIKYDPVRQDKQPFYLHSIQTYRTSKTTIGEVASIALIVIAIAVAWSILA